MIHYWIKLQKEKNVYLMVWSDEKYLEILRKFSRYKIFKLLRGNENCFSKIVLFSNKTKIKDQRE